MRISENLKASLYSLFFTLFSIFTHGYAYGIRDQAVHIPFILKLVNSSLYHNDLLFTAGQQNLSLFYPLIAYFIKLNLFSLEQIFFIGYFLFLLLFYQAIYSFLKKFVGQNIFLYFIAGFLFCFPMYIGGTAIESIEINFVPRFVTYILSIWCFYWLLNKKLLFVSLVSPLIFALHPISFVYFAAIVVTYLVISRAPIKIHHYSIFLIEFIVINYHLLVNIVNNLLNLNLSKTNNQWLTILNERNFYSFLENWSYLSWFYLIIIIIPILLYLFVLKKRDKIIDDFIIAVLISCLILTVIQFIFSSVYPIILIIQFQLARSWVFAYFASVICIVKMLSFSSNSEFIKRVTFIVFIILIYFSVFQKNKLYLLQNNPWRKLQLWVKNNTDENCVFLIPPVYQGFRVYSERPVVFEYKDGTLSYYSQEFALTWNERKKDLENWINLDSNDFVRLQTKYNYSYLISENNLVLPFENIYKDSVFIIYKMPQTENDCKRGLQSSFK